MTARKNSGARDFLAQNAFLFGFLGLAGLVMFLRRPEKGEP